MAKRDRSSAKPLEPSRGVAASAEKSIISIRMPVEVLTFVEGESRARAAALGLKGADLESAINITAQINRMLEGLRNWFGHREERARFRRRGTAGRGGLWRQTLISVPARTGPLLRDQPPVNADEPLTRARALVKVSR
jgi:hypothetical protein